MSDVAEFTVKLNDQFSNVASKVAGASKKIASEFQNLKNLQHHVNMAIGMVEDPHIRRMLRTQSNRRFNNAKAGILNNTFGLDPGLRLQELKNQKAARDHENALRKSLGMRQLPSLMENSPSMLGKAFRALNMGGMNTGILGQLVEMAPALAAAAAAVYALKTAFDFVSFSVQTVTEGIFTLGKLLVETTAHALAFTQRMEMGLTALTKHLGVDGVDVFNAIRGEAQRLGLDVEETTESFRKLIAAQFDVQTAMDLTRSVADLKASGASAAEIQRALLAISQIKTKGKLQSEEVGRQLANAGIAAPLIYDEIAKARGFTGKDAIDKVMKLQKAGKITSDEAIPAIIRAIGRKTGSETPGSFAEKKSTERIDGMISNLKSGVFNAFVDIAQLIQKPVTDAFKVVFTSLSGLMQSPVFQELKQSLADVFISAAGFVEKFWPQIEPILYGVAGILRDTFTNIADYINNNGDVIFQKFMTLIRYGYVFGSVMMDTTVAVYGLADSLIHLAAVAEKHLYTLEKIFKYTGIGLASTGILALPGAALYGMGSAAGSVGQSFGDITDIQKTSLRDQKGSTEETLMDSYLNNARPGASIRSFDDLIAQGGLGKSITMGDINVEANVVGLEDKEEFAESIGGIVRREVRKTIEETD